MPVREYTAADLPQLCKIWNEVVRAGDAFPQTNELAVKEAAEFFAAQSYTGVAVDEQNAPVGLYILHPNNIGRCGHLANASYAVSANCRGQGVGELLVRHCLKTAAEKGFKILQFNAVVAQNTAARRLYDKLGFTLLGTVPGGFLAPQGYLDICLYYRKTEM